MQQAIDNAIRAIVKLWVAVEIVPMIHGPACPPKLPIEFTSAMPAEAAEPDRYAVGSDQKEDEAEMMPAQARVRANKPKTPEMPGIAETANPMPPASAESPT